MVRTGGKRKIVIRNLDNRVSHSHVIVKRVVYDIKTQDTYTSGRVTIDGESIEVMTPGVDHGRNDKWYQV